MALPSTKTLDHIVHLTPPGSVTETAERFRRLGFNVLPGGKHADGLTENALVVLADSVYLELISFVHPVSAYPPGSAERLEREIHKWASKEPGWIDYAFLGNGSEIIRISDIINDRAAVGGDNALYHPEVSGGRQRPDGQILKWIITAPLDTSGIQPFFCGDVTSRDLRVPMDPSSNTEHSSTALGIAFVQLQVHSDTWSELSRKLDYVIGKPGVNQASSDERQWTLDTVNGDVAPACRLILSASDTTKPGVSEVAFYVKSAPENETIKTPYAQIRFITL